ncbi:MAG: gliding motility-associated C-terminal domain-containing protein [Crocinitomicaceae bacterium]|nr:gliding motility-associated C-terminal domain-containing protein [Crocinitomicaceae bacterium]
MKKLITLLILLNLTTHGFGQADWLGSIGLTTRTIASTIAVDNNDNVIIAGEFRATVDFDINAGTTNLTSQGSSDMFISKYDQNGVLLWAISMGGLNSDEISAVATDNNGNIYVTGRFQSLSVDMDPGVGVSNITSTSSTSQYDIFVAKYDSNGNHLWSFSYGTNTIAEAGNGIDVDNSGNVYITGIFRGTIDFDPGVGVANLTPNVSADVFVAKYSTNGNYLWAFNIGSSGNQTSTGRVVKADNLGNIYVGGSFQGSVDFDPGVGVSVVSGNTSMPDGFIAKYTENGIFAWVIGLTNSNQNHVYTLDVDEVSGELFAGGAFQGSVDFNPNGVANVLASPLGYNAFLTRYNTNGQLMWVRQFTGSSQLLSVSLSPNGNLWCTGEFRQTTDFDFPNGQTIVGNTGSGDIFVGRYNSLNGNYLCAYSLGSTGYDVGKDIAAFSNSKAAFTGHFQNTVDLDPGPGTNTRTTSDYATALIKLNTTCPGIIIPLNASITASNLVVCEGDTVKFTDNSAGNITSWQWTFNGGTNITSATTEGPHNVIFNTAGTYNIQLVVGDGTTTDTETISITVNSPAAGIDTQVACETYTWIDGNTYTSNNTTATFTIPAGAANGCDSIVTLALTINNSTTGIDTQVACETYTWIDGNTYTSNNTTATFTIPAGAANGCDSIVTLALTINNATTGIDTQVACETYTWIDGNTYTSNNTTATFTIPAGAANGCDSIVTLALTINNSTTGIDTQVACETYTWIDGNTYTSNNTTATFTIPAGAANGCDSIVTLALTINNPTTGIDTQIACETHTWIDGNTYTSNNTTATFTILGGAANGCDSIVTLNLTIQALPTINGSSNSPICEGQVLNLSSTTISGASYQWTGPNGYTSQLQNPIIAGATSLNSGVYTVVVSVAANCSSTDQVNVTVNPLPVLNSVFNADSCELGIGQITLNSTSPNTPLTYVWTNGSTDSLLTGLTEGSYGVTVTDAASCAVSQTFLIANSFDGCDCFVYVANAFSPNGDSNNDLIPVRGKCVATLSFKIFNRWGNLVFQTDKLDDGWNGYYKDHLQNTAVFVYTLDATFDNGKTIQESGNINLIR